MSKSFNKEFVIHFLCTQRFTIFVKIVQAFLSLWFQPSWLPSPYVLSSPASGFAPHQLFFRISQWPFNINIETSVQFCRLRFYPVFAFIKSALLSILSNFSIHSILQDIFYSILTGTSFSSLPQQKYPAIVQITHNKSESTWVDNKVQVNKIAYTQILLKGNSVKEISVHILTLVTNEEFYLETIYFIMSSKVVQCMKTRFHNHCFKPSGYSYFKSGKDRNHSLSLGSSLINHISLSY